MWKSQSTVDPLTIARWWKTWPDAVPGIDMGKSGLLAFDCDRGKPDDTHIVDALGWLREFARTHHGSVLGAPTSETPSGGMHVIYRNRAVNPFGNSRGNLPPKGEVPIDIRGAGGYIIAPGAIFADGGHYVAHGALIEAFPLPDWAVALLQPAAPPAPPPTPPPASVPASVRHSSDAATTATTANSANSATSVATVATVAGEKHGRKGGEAREKIQKSERVFSLRKNSWGEAALDGLADDLAAAQEGERNNRANEISYRAGRMVGGGLFGHSEALARLTAAALSWGIPPRDRVLGARGTIARALRDGASKAPAITGPEDDVPYVDEGLIDGLIDIEALKANAARRRGEVSHETQLEIGGAISDATLDDDNDDEQSEPPEPPDEPPPPSIHDLVAGDWTHPDGLLGAIADWIEATARYPNRALAVGAATAVLSTLCGRHLYGPTGAALNLYILLLADTGYGKDWPLAAPHALLCAAGFPKLTATAKAFSVSALEQLVADRPCCLGVADEIAKSLLERILSRKASTHESAMKSALLSLWSRYQNSAPFSTTRKAKVPGSHAPVTIDIPSPAFSILGASAPKPFYEVLSSGSIHDGFLNRFLLCHAGPAAEEAQEVGEEGLVVPQELAEGLRQLVPRLTGNVAEVLGVFTPEFDLSLVVHRVPWANDETRDAARSFEKQMRSIARANAEEGELLIRTFEMAVRLATLHAVGRAGLRLQAAVDEQDWSWARSFALSSSQGLVRDAGLYMADSESQETARAIKRKLLARGGRGMTHHELIRSLDSKYEPRKLRDILRSLLESRQIRSTPVPTKGRPATRYNWAGK
jgi:hypothetical protein